MDKIFDDCGSGFPVVLIHGHPFDRTMWMPQISALSRNYRVIAPDLRGYGRNPLPDDNYSFESFALDIVRLTNELRIARFALCGLSMGGQIALECMCVDPERIAALVLADTFATLDSPERKQARYQAADRILREGMREYALELLPKMIMPEHTRTQPDVAAHVLHMMRTAPPRGAAAALRARSERRDYTSMLAEIRVPTLVIVGERDEFTPVPDAQFLHGRIGGSELVVIKDAGHLPNLEQPAAFNEALITFLSRSVPQESGSATSVASH